VIKATNLLFIQHVLTIKEHAIMATEWFCRIMGEEWGPMSARELTVVAERGRLTRDDVVRRGATGTWVRAENVNGLFEATVPAATATSHRVALRQRHAAPAPRSVRAARVTSYWIHNGETILGPFNSQRIRRLAAEGALDPNHLLRNDRSRWIRAWRIEGLTFGPPTPLAPTVAHDSEARQRERPRSTSNIVEEVELCGCAPVPA
jgi:hypothetical protein